MRSLLVLALAAAVATAANSSFPAEKFGYVPISGRWGSAMFYAIRGDAAASQEDRASRPTILWLQGGPGASSMFGDFLETGPMKLSKTASGGATLSPRQHTWVKHVNMVYVDNPVGTGYSYTTDPNGFATSDDQIAADLVTFLQGFLTANPEYRHNDFWVFCESYGGKMTAYFGAALQRAVASGVVSVNFKGVALGDGWVDPIGCMYSYGPYLKAFGQLNAAQVANVTKYAQYAQDALERGNGTQATNYWGIQQGFISQFAANVNWYNTLYYYDYTAENQWTQYMTSNFTQYLVGLGVPIPSWHTFASQGMAVFVAMQPSFMRDGVSQVQEMIDAGLSVNVYGGQVDLIVDTLCIQGWMAKLTWGDLSGFQAATRTAFMSDDQTQSPANWAGFVQRYKNLAFWQINKAGHMVPLDQPAAAETMMVKIITGDRAPPRAVNPDNGADTADFARKAGTKGTIHVRSPLTGVKLPK